MLAAFCIWRLDDLLFVINRFPLSLHNGVSCTKKKNSSFLSPFFTSDTYNWIRKIMESCCSGRNKINPLFCRDLGKEAIQWRWKDWKGKNRLLRQFFSIARKKVFISFRQIWFQLVICVEIQFYGSHCCRDTFQDQSIELKIFTLAD